MAVKPLHSAANCFSNPPDHRGEEPMRTRAAVAFEAGKPLEITLVNLEGPKAGDVMV